MTPCLGVALFIRACFHLSVAFSPGTALRSWGNGRRTCCVACPRLQRHWQLWRQPRTPVTQKTTTASHCGSTARRAATSINIHPVPTLPRRLSQSGCPPVRARPQWNWISPRKAIWSSLDKIIAHTPRKTTNGDGRRVTHASRPVKTAHAQLSTSSLHQSTVTLPCQIWRRYVEPPGQPSPFSPRP